MSFLPLYYGILSLSKLVVVLSGNGAVLAKASDRYHGAAYTGITKQSHSLLTDTLTLHPGGVLGRYYEALTGKTWIRKKRTVKVGDFYSYIPAIEHERAHAFGGTSPLQPVDLFIEGDANTGFRLAATLGLSAHPDASKKSKLKILSGLGMVAPRRFASKYCVSTSPWQFRAGVEQWRRSLLYERWTGRDIISLTPLSGSHVLLPPEIPVWLAFFHLSNVVRYHPEFLAKAG